MHAVVSLWLQNRKFWWYLLLTCLLLLHNVIMTSYCCQRYGECPVTTLFQHIYIFALVLNLWMNEWMTVRAPAVRHNAPRTCNSLTAASRNAKLLLRPTCDLQTAQISILWMTRFGLSYSIASTTNKSIMLMNWNGGSSMSGVVLNSRFLTILLTSGEEDIERLSMLKENIS